MLPNGFDFHAIEVFMATADRGGMTQAAAHFGITQSAVSQTISRLETGLKVKLFDRALRPMKLTSSGHLLYRQSAQLLASARALSAEVRGSDQQPIEHLTIAMAESIANLLTAPLLAALGSEAARWQLRSGISLLQHHEFFSRKIDILMTGSSELGDIDELESHTILHEAFVVVTPISYDVALDDLGALTHKPFIRFSLLSSMGQRIEQQLSRMRLPIERFVEVDSTMQQLSAVSHGIGWSITTPLCLAAHLNLLSELKVAPMRQAQFRRHVRVIARRGEFGALPERIAAESRAILRRDQLMALSARLPWIDDAIGWTADVGD